MCTLIKNFLMSPVQQIEMSTLAGNDTKSNKNKNNEVYKATTVNIGSLEFTVYTCSGIASLPVW